MVAHYGDMNLGRKDETGVKAFYREIPPEGGRGNSVGPVQLKNSLDIKQTKFEQYKQILLEHELIGTVQGGGIYRILRGDDYKETDYYEPIRRELEVYWAEDRKRQYHLRQRFLRVLDTHHRGAARDGRWARPDLTLLGGKVLPYLPGKFLDVVTFEVKLGIPVEGLYEALAHRRRANYSYLVCVYPAHKGSLDPAEEATIVVEATRQGLGVLLVRQEDDFDQWHELVEPVRHEPDPQLLHDFLEAQCNRGKCLPDLQKWLQMDDFGLPRPVTDHDVRRLNLTTEELDAALRVVHLLAKSDDTWGPTSLKKELQDLDMDTLVRAKEALRDEGFIETVQGGGVRRAKATYDDEPG